MDRRVMLVLCTVLAAIGIMIACHGGFGGTYGFNPGAMFGIIIAACGLGGAMGTSMVASGICQAAALIVLVTAGISVGSILLCCIPATMLALHLARVSAHAR